MKFSRRAAARAMWLNIGIHLGPRGSGQKLPGGWGTALAVKHFLKRNSSGAVAPYAFYDEHYLKFSRGKLNDFEGTSWYLQGFVVVAGWKPFACFSLACHFSKRLLRARPMRLRKSVEFPWCHRQCQILLFLEAIEGSQHHLYVCSKRMILHLWKFSTFHRCHRCALASFPISFSW